MMKEWRRRTAAVLAVALCVGLLSGCTSTSGGSNQLSGVFKKPGTETTAVKEDEALIPEIDEKMYGFLDVGEERCWTFAGTAAGAINLHLTEVTEKGCTAEWEPHANYVFDPESGYLINGQHMGHQECTFRMLEPVGNTRYMEIEGIEMTVNGIPYTFAVCDESEVRLRGEIHIIACRTSRSTDRCLWGYVDEDETWGQAEAVPVITDHWQSEWEPVLKDFLFRQSWESIYADLPQELRDRLGEQAAYLTDDAMIWYVWLGDWIASFAIREVNEIDLTSWRNYDVDEMKDFWNVAERGVSVYVRVNYDAEKTQYTDVNLMILYAYGQWIVTGFKQGLGFEMSPTWCILNGKGNKLWQYLPAHEGDHLYDMMADYGWYSCMQACAGAIQSGDREAALKAMLPGDRDTPENRKKLTDDGRLDQILAHSGIRDSVVFSFEYRDTSYKDYDEDVSVVIEYTYKNTDYNMDRKANYELVLRKADGNWYCASIRNAAEGGAK